MTMTIKRYNIDNNWYRADNNYKYNINEMNK